MNDADDFLHDAEDPEAPDEVAVLLAAIRATPLAVRSIEVAAEAVDNGMPLEAMDLLRDAAQIVRDQYPGLLVSGPTIAAIMATIVRGMRDQRAVRLQTQ